MLKTPDAYTDQLMDDGSDMPPAASKEEMRQRAAELNQE